MVSSQTVVQSPFPLPPFKEEWVMLNIWTLWKYCSEHKMWTSCLGSLLYLWSFSWIICEHKFLIYLRRTSRKRSVYLEIVPNSKFFIVRGGEMTRVGYNFHFLGTHGTFFDILFKLVVYQIMNTTIFKHFLWVQGFRGNLVPRLTINIPP